MFDIAEQSMWRTVATCQPLNTTVFHDVNLGGATLPNEVRKRPVFLPELGQFFKDLREARGWTLRGAASQAERWDLPKITYQVLFRLERGQTKHPDPDVLNALARLYELPYDDLVARWVKFRFGSDLLRHSADQQSALPVGGAQDVAASARRIAELESELSTLKARWVDVQDVARTLFRIAVAEEDRTAARAPARRRGTTRKTGR